MFFILSKILLYFIQPSIILIALIICSFFLKNAKWKKRARILAIVGLFFFTNTVIIHEFYRFWEVPGKKISTLKQYDVAIVLGGMFAYNNDLKEISILRSGDRIWQTLNLYHRKKVKKILISGDDGHLTDQGLDEANQLKAILIERGIPEHDILTENISRNTYENAVESKKVLTKHPELKSYLLVTSGTHMRRSAAIFRKQGMKFDVFSTDMHTGPKRNYSLDAYFIPTLAYMDNWDKLIKEMVGYVVYDITGKI